MKKTSLLELAKKLNIPRWNCMKTKEELEEAIKDTITGYKKIIFGSDTPLAWRVWRNFKSSKSLIKKYMIKSWWRIRWGNSHGRDFKDILRWMVTRWSIRRQVSCWILKLIPHTGKTHFKLIFIVFIDHKITCRRTEKLHIVDRTDILNNWSVCDFSKKIFFAFFSSLFK